jgi:ornithine--oxo-acid transaminase
MDSALPMNSGAEAVETALKAAREWAYKVKGVPTDQAEIIAAEGNFNGRTISIVGFSSVAQYRDGFGPFPSGFKLVPFGDAAALAAAITPETAAFLIEPIQGEGGINVPPPGYLSEVARICRVNNVLLLCDEVQSGLGRTGGLLACQHDSVQPDGLILGKALGGGLLPVSLFLARRDVMNVFTPGDHGSTLRRQSDRCGSWAGRARHVDRRAVGGTPSARICCAGSPRSTIPSFARCAGAACSLASNCTGTWRMLLR